MGDTDPGATAGAPSTPEPTPAPAPAPKPRRERAAEPSQRYYAAIRGAGGYAMQIVDLPASVAARYTVETRAEDTLPRVAAYIDRELRREQFAR